MKVVAVLVSFKIRSYKWNHNILMMDTFNLKKRVDIKGTIFSHATWFLNRE